jgi:hypothetical protein
MEGSPHRGARFIDDAKASRIRAMSAEPATIADYLARDLGFPAHRLAAHPGNQGDIAILLNGTQKTAEPVVLAYVTGEITRQEMVEGLWAVTNPPAA